MNSHSTICLSRTLISGKQDRVGKKSACRDTQRRTKTGVETRRKILQAAERLLVEAGHHQLSMRQVAETCKIGVGNLTYYFPTKESLLNALVDHILDGYLKEFRRLLSGKKFQTESGIKLFVEWLLQDAVRAKTSQLNREIWAMSSHYPEVQKRLVNLYNELIRFFIIHLKQKCSGLPEPKLQQVGCLIAVFTEGTSIVYGGRYRLPVSSQDMIPVIVEMVTESLET